MKSRAEKDIHRFSKLHLWYKELPLKGENFIIFPWKGKQPQNYLTLPDSAEDAEKYTWHIWRASRIDEIPLHGIEKDVVMRRSVIFNSFLWGVSHDKEGNVFLPGWGVLRQRYPQIEEVLREKYGSKPINEMVKAEQKVQIQKAIQTAREIVSEMIIRCPVGIGLPSRDLAASDPTIQICEDNLRRDYTSRVIKNEGQLVLDIQRGPEETPKVKGPRSPRPSPERHAIRRKLSRKLSLRELPKLSLPRGPKSPRSPRQTTPHPSKGKHVTKNNQQ